MIFHLFVGFEVAPVGISCEWCRLPQNPHQAALSLFSAMHLARLTTSRSATALTLGLGEMRKNRWRRALDLQVPFVVGLVTCDRFT